MCSYADAPMVDRHFHDHAMPNGYLCSPASKMGYWFEYSSKKLRYSCATAPKKGYHFSDPATLSERLDSLVH